VVASLAPLAPPSGTHCLLDLHGCPAERLALPLAELERLARDAAEQAGARVLGVLSHAFAPTGATVVCLLAESHLTLHTWPERGYAAVDVFTCGASLDPRRACDSLARALGATRVTLQSVPRGER
jgi:S-adenosylmethionine decarboxylase